MEKATTEKKLLKCPISTTNIGHFDMKNNVISEPELMDNLESKAVKTMALVQGEDGKFYVYVTLTWKEERQLLETQRKEPRTWASLDRLVKHINQKYENVPIIQLELWSNNNESRKHRKRDQSGKEGS
ncbi:hypothetical protein M3890_004653 [Vibrio parahaemolyticus]|nr:hypothetical protein [Vibrio parahaemolyticus]HBC3550346.1 hypothetical protein [Vibrio parahaemolyticus]